MDPRQKASRSEANWRSTAERELFKRHDILELCRGDVWKISSRLNVCSCRGDTRSDARFWNQSYRDSFYRRVGEVGSGTKILKYLLGRALTIDGHHIRIVHVFLKKRSSETRLTRREVLLVKDPFKVHVIWPAPSLFQALSADLHRFQSEGQEQTQLSNRGFIRRRFGRFRIRSYEIYSKINTSCPNSARALSTEGIQTSEKINSFVSSLIDCTAQKGNVFFNNTSRVCRFNKYILSRSLPARQEKTLKQHLRIQFGLKRHVFSQLWLLILIIWVPPKKKTCHFVVAVNMFFRIESRFSVSLDSDSQSESLQVSLEQSKSSAADFKQRRESNQLN